MRHRRRPPPGTLWTVAFSDGSIPVYDSDSNFVGTVDPEDVITVLWFDEFDNVTVLLRGSVVLMNPIWFDERGGAAVRLRRVDL